MTAPATMTFLQKRMTLINDVLSAMTNPSHTTIEGEDGTFLLYRAPEGAMVVHEDLRAEYSLTPENPGKVSLNRIREVMEYEWDNFHKVGFRVLEGNRFSSGILVAEVQSINNHAYDVEYVFYSKVCSIR